MARNKYSGDRGSSGGGDRGGSGGGDRSAKRQGNLEFNPSLHNEKPDKHYLIQKFQDSQRQAQIESRTPTAGGKSKDRYFKESGTVIDHSGSNNTNRIRRDSDHRTPHRRHGECYLYTEIHSICRPVCMGCLYSGRGKYSFFFIPSYDNEKEFLDVGRKQRVKKYFLRRVTKKVLTPPWLLYCALCIYLCSSKLKVYKVTFNGIYKPFRVE